MKWTRYKLLIISGGITLVLSGVLVFWVLTTRGNRSEVQNQINNMEQQRTLLSSEKPFPSKQNFDQLKSEQEKVIAQRDQLKSLIRAGQLKTIQVSRSRFGDYIKGEYVPELRAAAKAATKGGEHGVILTDPDFGLTEYLKGLPPETGKIPELLLELQTKAQLSMLLFDSGISELDLVKVIKDEKDSNSRTGRLSPSIANMPGFDMMGQIDPLTGAPMADTETDAGLSELQKEKKRLFNFKDYRLEFKVYEDYLWETLNAISADPNQLVITELYITNADKSLWPDYLQPALGADKGGQQRRETRQTPRTRNPTDEMTRLLLGAGDPDAAVQEKESEMQIAGLAERRQNVIGGNLLNVVIVVRVYRLIDRTSETEKGL